MSHKIRLGPIAVFLAVIAAVVATLAILTFATSRADVALAERFAAVTVIRYELDEEGGRFLQEVEEAGAQAAGNADTLAAESREEGQTAALAAERREEGETAAQVQEGQALLIGNVLAGDVSALDGGGWKYYTEKDGYALTVEVVPTGEAAAGNSDLENEESVADADTEIGAAKLAQGSRWQIRKWKINKLWEGDDPFEDLWLG